MRSRLGILFVVLAGLAGSAVAGTTFTLQLLPSERPDAVIAWHDVNGDGRKDFVCQADRRIEVRLMGERHQLSPKADWTVEMVPPWDLWDFADVRPDVPGEELLALSPNGVGWLSFQRHTTSTALMDLLVTATLPVLADSRQGWAGHFVVRTAKDRPPDLLLPTRGVMRLYRRQAEGGPWANVEDLPAPIRPWPIFRAKTTEPYLMGFDRMPLLTQTRPLTPPASNWLIGRELSFRSAWSSSGGWLMDWNGDGRLDWAASGAGAPGGLRVYLQTAEGKFDRDHVIVPMWPVPPAPQEDKAGQRLRREKPRADSAGGWMQDNEVIQLENLADVDGDGRLDVVRLSTVESWAAPKTHVSVFLQKSDASFPAQPDSTLRLPAIMPTDMAPLADLNGDGALDLVLLRLDLQVASLHSHMKAFLRRGLETYLGAYFWNKRSGWSKRPAWEKMVLISHDMFEFTRDPEPVMEFDRDMTGDGQPDLVLRQTRDSVALFPLIDPKKGFTESPVAALTVPFTIERMECGDFDGDGVMDVRITGWDPDNRDRIPRAVFFGEKK